MAVPVRLRDMPEHIRAPHLAADVPGYSLPSRQNGASEEQQLLQFPKSSCILWDGTSMGQPVFIHVAQHRRPQIHVSEKVLWLIHRQCENEGTSNRVLVGSLSVDEDAEGVCFHIDGLDTRQSGADTSSDMDLGDVMIPVQVSSSREQDRTGSAEDYHSAVQMLKQRVCGREPLELSSLLLVKGWCSFYSSGDSEKTVAHLQFDVVTLATVLKATPVNAVPIVPTALAKNLAGPRNLSHLQGRPKTGFLTMDHTRKLLLVLESDPKVSSLPIVGIWVSGVPLVQHPFAWTACLRYLHTQQLQDRVCTPPEGFLLLLYSPLHSKPEFYEMSTTSGKSDLQFDLYTGYEITSFYKKSSGPDPASIQWEMSPVRSGPKRELFDAAVGRFESVRQGDQGRCDSPASATTTASEDIMPRSIPAPHAAKAMVVKHMVPEVSMLWAEDAQPAALAPPVPSAQVNGHHANPVHSGLLASSYRFSVAAPLPSQAEPRGTMPAFVNDGIAVSNSNNGCQLGFGGQQFGRCIPQQSATLLRPPLQERAVMQNSVSQNCGYPTASVRCANIRQPVSSQPFNAPPNQGYLVSISQGITPVHFLDTRGSVPQHCAHPASGPRDPSSHTVPSSSSHFVKQHPPLGPPSSMQQTRGPSSQHSVAQPCSVTTLSTLGSTQPRFLPPAAMHLCRPHSIDPNHVPHSIRFQGQGQMVPSILPGFAGTDYVNINQAHLQAESPRAFASQPVEQYHYKPAGDNPPFHSPVGQKNNTQNQFPHQIPYQDNVGPFGRSHNAQENGPQLSAPQTDQFQPQGIKGYPPPVISAPSHSHMPLPHMPSKSASARSTSALVGNITTAGCAVSFPVSSTHLEGGQRTGSDNTQADSTSCSGKSSDDSGLSVTPDRSNPSPKPPASPQTEGHAPPSAALTLGGGVNWEGVPAEVVQLLVHQDAQLKVLQAQIQQLLSQQQQQQHQQQQLNSSSTASTSQAPQPSCPTPSYDPGTVRKKTCSVAVNTTLLVPQQNPTQFASVQTSPQKAWRSNSSGPPGGDMEEAGGQFVNQSSAPPTPGPIGVESAGQTPSDIRHEGALQLNSTQRGEGPGTSALSMGSIPSSHSSSSEHQGHASPARLPDTREQASSSLSSSSPLSASMCVQAQEGEDSKEEVSPDSKEYYDQLINNIRLFLNNHSKDTEDSQRDCSELPSGEETYTQLKLMETALPSSPAQHSCPSAVGSTNTTLLPHINYLSMMLGSESDTSVEINALAMKYLRDEQLTQMARLRQAGSSRFTGGNLLRQALAASADATPVLDTSRLGTAVNMSMATKKYLEKHGLLGAGDESLFDSNQTFRLQTDFSLAVTSEPRSGPSLPSSPLKGTPRAASHSSPGLAAINSPVKKEVLQPLFQPSPVILEDRENSYEDRRPAAPDLGASPVLRPAPARQNYNHNQGRRYRERSPDDTPIFPERYREGRAQDIRSSECSAATEDDRILDIEKLKQMPKLL